MTTPQGSDNYRNLTIAGVSWTLVGSVVGRLLHFGIGIVLARLLVPSDFGLISMVFVFIGFANIFCHLGFPSALIFTKEVDEGHYSSVFWTCLVCGVVAFATAWFAAPLISSFYDQKELASRFHDDTLTWITRLLACGLLVESLRVVPLARLTKEMRFPLMTKIQLGGSLSLGVVTVGFAWMDWGFWALALQQTLTPLVELIGFAIAARWRPQLTWQWRKIRDLLRISLNGMGSILAQHWSNNLDNLLIARFLGATTLGIYTRCYSLMMLPNQVVMSSFGSVLSPMLTELRDDRPRAGRYYLRSLGVVVFVVAPTLLILSALTADFVLGVYGEKWAAMVPVLRILAILGVLHVILPIHYVVLLTQNRPGACFFFQMLLFVTNLIAVVAGFHWGLLGISWGLLITTSLILAPTISYTLRFLELPLRAPLLLIGQMVLMAGTAGLAAWGVAWLLPAGWLHLLRLGVCVWAGILTYWALAVLFKPVAYTDGMRVVKERLAKRRGRG